MQQGPLKAELAVELALKWTAEKHTIYQVASQEQMRYPAQTVCPWVAQLSDVTLISHSLYT